MPAKPPAQQKTSPSPRLQTYEGPWTRNGQQLLLACAKCQKKLRHDGDPHGLGRLKRTLKTTAKRHDEPLHLRVIKVPCLNVCPTGGVAVCTQAQLGAGLGSVLRTAADADLLYTQTKMQTHRPRLTSDTV